ncbi:MAG: glycosyltransferase family 39 protein [Candidatus Omnitrophica bacterium]|nr:glycosyltransferase family 39 protein [Candidatus Omnitrophota bacterium]
MKRAVIIILGVCILFGALAVTRNPYNRDWTRGELSHVVAYNLCTTGKMFPDAPYVARPPGYIYFIAAVFSASEFLAPQFCFMETPEGHVPVKTNLLVALFIAQIFVHAANAVLLYLWAGRLMDRRMALVIALCFGTSVYWLLQIASVHYAVWHLFWVLAAGYTWTLAWQERERSLMMGLSGLLWGIATLVRPVTLLLPLFAVPAAVIAGRGDKHWVIRFTLLIILGMAVFIGPNTLRNYRLTGRWIPVNAQAAAALWGGTEPHPGISPKHYFWPRLLPEFERIYRGVTGDNYTYAGYVRHNLALEDAFRREAWRNIRERPGVYAGNVLTNLKLFAVGVDSGILNGYLARRHGEDRTATTRPFDALMILLTVLAGLAGYAALRARDTRLLVPAAVLLCYGLGHALTYLDINYYYFKQPFLYLGAGYLLSRLCCSSDRPGAGWRIAGYVMTGAVICVTAMSWRIFF